MFRRGDLLFSQSQPVKALFILKSGRVRIFRVAEDGNALTMAILEPGAVFGEMMLVGQRMYDNYAEAIEDSAICQLSVDEVERFLLSDPVSRSAPPAFWENRSPGLLGASRETTSKIMGELTARKAIRQGRGRIVIQDRDILYKMARSTSGSPPRSTAT